MIRLAMIAALAALAGCARWDPEEPPRPDLDRAARIEEARRLADAGLTAQAEAAIDRLIADAPAMAGDAAVAALKAQMLVARGELPQAIPWFERAVGAAPLWIEPRRGLADAWLALERPAAAASVYADIDRMFPDSAYGPWGLAVVASRRGDVAEVQRQADAALAREPDRPGVLRLAAWAARAANQPEREEGFLRRAIAKDGADAESMVRLGDLIAGDRPEESRSWWSAALRVAGHPGAAARLRRP